MNDSYEVTIQSGSDTEKTIASLSNLDITLPDISVIEINEYKLVIDDTCKNAIKFSFAGFGQGGSNIVDAFYNIGYRRCCVCNTTIQDTQNLITPNKLFMDIGDGGAGKDIEKGKFAADKYSTQIYDTMRVSFGNSFDRIICVAGLGGGTGSLSILKGIEKAKAYINDLQINSKVGVLVTLPQNDEGKTVSNNAYKALSELTGMVQMGHISPLIIIDNDRMARLYSKLPIGKLWKVIDNNIATIFNMFNFLANQPSEISTFDKADFSDILDSGIIIFGVTPVGQWTDNENLISQAIAKNLTSGMFAEGFNLKKCGKYGMIIVGEHDILQNNLTKAQIDAGVRTLNSEVASNVTSHVGILSANTKGLAVYTMLGGLTVPEQRIGRLK